MKSRYQLAGLGLVTAAALAQTSDQPVIRVGTRLVQINVIVHDKNGPVSDLKKQDFTLLDKGRPREITVFRMDSRLSDEEKFRKQSQLAPNVFTNNQADAANTSIVLFDAINTTIPDQMYAKRQIIKFLGALKPDDRVGIYLLAGGLQVLHDFTSDTKSLLATVRRFNSSSNGLADGGSLDSSSDALNQFLDHTNHGLVDGIVSGRVRLTTDALKGIARHVERMPGRKNLIWVSGTFPIMVGFEVPPGLNDRNDRRVFNAEIEEAARELMKANIAVYPVDARGLMVDPKMSAQNGSAPTPISRAPVMVKPPLGAANQDTMTLIAERTGGKAFFNTNDITGSVRRAIDDSEVTYTLGFYLSQDEMDSKFHELKVKVDRKGVDVRARKGFLAYQDGEAAATVSPAKREGVIKEALASPLDATGLTIAFRLDRADQVKPGAIQVTAFVDPKPFVFEQREGRYVDTTQVVFAQLAANGLVLDSQTQTANLSMTPDRYKMAMSRPLELKQTMVPKPGAVFVRVVVLDHGSGQIGSSRGELGWILSQSPQPLPPAVKN